MIKFAICDDNAKELTRLSQLTKEYFEKIHMEYHLCEYTNSDELLRVCEKEVFHIYILDIVMPLVDGIELGKEIRRRDREAQIIYATTEPQYALAAYQANPLNYLIKPIEQKQLCETLKTVISEVQNAGDSVFTVKNQFRYSCDSV